MLTSPPPPDIQFGRRTWSFTWDHAHITLTDVREGRDDTLYAEVTVDVLVPPSPGRIFGPARVNLLAPRSVSGVAKDCSDRDGTFDWGGALLQVVEAATRRWREGDPLVPLADIEDVGRPQFLVPPIVEADGVTVVFAPGGSGKSMLSLVVALTVATGAPQAGALFDGAATTSGPVAILDWESGPVVQKRRMERLAAGLMLDPPRNVLYRRETAPLHSTVDRLAERFEEEGVVFAVVDSLGLARGGAPEDAEATIRVFAAMRELGVPVLAIDHLAKAQMDTKPGQRQAIGSVYTTNASRRAWALTGRSDGNATVVRVECTKVNDGLRPAPRAWRFIFDPDRTLVTLADPDEEAPAAKSQWEMVADAIAASDGRLLFTKEIAEITGIPDGQVRVILGRRPDVFVSRARGAWGLAADALMKGGEK